MTKRPLLLCGRFRAGLFLFLCVAAVADRAAAQATLTLTGGSGTPGGTVTVGISLNTNGTQPAALQFDLTYPATDLSPGPGTYFATGAAASAAGKSASCSNPSAGDVRCIIAGFNTTAMAGGSVASVTFQIANTSDPSALVNISGASASDGTGNNIPITGGSVSVTITQSGISLTNLTCSPATVTTPASSNCAVTLSGNVASNTSVSLGSNNGSAGVPGTVTVNRGQSTANFTVTTTAVGAQTQAVITATLGSTSKPFTLTLNPANPAIVLSSLSCGPANVTPPASSTCTVTLSGNAASSTSVSLGSNSPSAAVPGTVTVNAGQSTANFTVTTNQVGAQTQAVITATLGSTSKPFTLTLTPVIALSSLSCSPASVTPPASSTCTVTLNGNAASSTSVSLASNNASAAVPGTVTVNAGQSTANFTVTTNQVGAQTQAVITATLGSTSKPFTLTLTSVIVLSGLSCSPASVAPPASSTCTVTLSGNAASSTSVSLGSNNASAAVPGTVTVNAGQSTAHFTVTTTAVGAQTQAVITATLGSTLKPFTLILTTSAVTQPAVSSMVCSPSTVTSGSSVSCTVYLAAAAPAGGTPVALASNNQAALAGAQVIVPAGLTSTTFTVATTAVTSVQNASISASSAGVTKTATFTMQPAAAALAGLSCTPGTIAPGASSTCTVSLTAPAPTGGATVSVSSSSFVVAVNSPVVVPAGSTSVNFLAGSGSSNTTGSAILTASYNGATATFTMLAGPQSGLSSLVCTPTTVAAGSATNCTISLSAPVSGGTTATLSSSNPQVTVPASVFIPGGVTAGVFTASAGASASGIATISVTVGAAVRSAGLVIAPSSGSASLMCTPATIQTPGSSTCTLSLGSPAQATRIISLTSTSPSVTLPQSINIGAGLTSATFTAKAATVQTITTVSIGAPSVGLSDSVTLLAPLNTSVSATAISCNPQTLTGGGTSTCQIALSGPAPSSGTSIQLSSTSTQISVPAVVPAAAGSTSVAFTATSSVITRDENAQLTASIGSATAQTTLALVSLKPAALVCPQTLISGSPLNCQLTLNSSQAAGSIVVGLSSNNNYLRMPATVSGPAGQSAFTFQVNTAYVTSNQAVTVSASIDGVAVQASVTLTPAPPVITVPARQTVNPGQTVQFTVTSSDPAGLAVQLTASGMPPNASFDPYTGVFNWTPQASQAGLYSVSFTGTNLALASATEDAVIEVLSSTPVITSLINAASFTDVGCSPGAVSTLLGTGFVKSGDKAAETSPLPTQLIGLSVQANGVALPVFYASESQVNFQCPALAIGTPVSLVIQSETGASAPLATTTQFATPGIYALNENGKGQGAILVSGTANFAMTPTKGIASQAAPLGSSISIYASGLGTTSVNVEPGAPAPSDPLAEVTAPVDVLINGEQAEVALAALMPGYSGLYQVNAKVPADAPIGTAIPVQLVVHGANGTTVKSNIVTIAISPAAN